MQQNPLNQMQSHVTLCQLSVRASSKMSVKYKMYKFYTVIQKNSAAQNKTDRNKYRL